MPHGAHLDPKNIPELCAKLLILKISKLYANLCCNTSSPYIFAFIVMELLNDARSGLRKLNII